MALEIINTKQYYCR